MLICNTRALNTPVTGVQRYMLEILNRLPQDQVRRITPPLWVKRPFNLLWEQTILPFHLMGKKRLWSPSNTGPLLISNQVITIHDLATIEFPQDFSPLYRRYFDFLFPRLLPRVASIITVSEYTRQRVLETYRDVLPEKVHAIPLGVDHDRFKPQTTAAIEAMRNRMKLPARYVLYLGTLSVRKNIGQLIRAWAKIQGEVGLDVHLVIAGDVGSKHVFNGSILPDFPPRTLLTGRVAEAELAGLLAGASAFVFPSLYEGFGLPPLEAMACGAPCITSDVTSLPEVVGDAGLIVSPHDDDALAHALQRLLMDDGLAKDLKEKGITRAAQFTWEKTAAATWKVLNES